MARTPFWLAALALAIGLTVLALPVQSADDKKDAPPAEDAPDPVLEVSANAYKTAEFGREHKSPEALLAAAVMLKSLKTAKCLPIAEQPTDENGKALEDKALESKSFGDEADELFEEASLMAADLKIAGFDAIIKAAKSRETRGIAGGAKTIRRKIGPGKTEVFHFKFEVGKTAPFTFHASEPLSLHAVNNDFGDTWVNGVFKHYEHNNPNHVGGKPKQKTAPVTFTIHNPGKKPVEYTLFIK